MSPKRKTKLKSYDACFSPVLLSSPGPSESRRVCVQSFQPEHAHPCLRASLPEKEKARNTQSRLESGMRHGFPCTNLFNSASSWEFSVSKCLRAHVQSAWEHMCIVPGFIVTLPQDRKWGLSCRSTTQSMHRWKKYSSVQPLSPVRLFATPWTAACQPSLSITNSHFGLLSHVHWVSDAIQPSHPLSSCSPPAFNLPQHQGLFKWVSFSHQVVKVLEFQLQYQSFQWIFRTDFL